MNRKGKIVNSLVVALMAFSIAFLILAMSNPRLPGDTVAAAARVERVVAERLSILEGLPKGETGSVPRDMVVYRYENDSLKSWYNQFSVTNDDIGSKLVFQRLVNPRLAPGNPLSGIGDTISFRNFGPKWYLVWMDVEDNVKIIKGFLVVNSLDQRTFNGTNPYFHLAERYSIRPLSASGGTEVCVGGVPQFKVLYDSLEGTATTDATLLCIAFVLFIFGALLFLWANPVTLRFLGAAAGVLVSCAAMYFWGRTAQNDYRLFSPILYADGAVLYSLGAVLIINAAITLLCVCLFIYRRRITAKAAPFFTVLAAGIALHTHILLRSIIMNSNITLELYKFGELSVYTLVVYASFLMLLLGIPLIFKILRHSLEVWWRIVFAVLLALYFVVATSGFGFRKEENKLEVLSNRLAIDRDISLEMQLRRVENDIAGDPFIASLSLLENGASSIENRLQETYFSRYSQIYRVSVLTSPRDMSRIRGGEPVAEGSRFLYLDDGSAHPFYVGVFHYSIQGAGITRIMVRVEREWERSTRGYAHILGFAPPGRVVVPSSYSYARYDGGKLISFTGVFAYPTSLEGKFLAEISNPEACHFFDGGYTHFVNRISGTEAVVVSRESVSVVNYFIEFFFLAILVYLLVSAVAGRNGSSREPGKSYYRPRIRWVLMSSLWLTLVAMTMVSVTFVYNRNESNLKSMMSDRINAVLSMIESRTRAAENVEDLKGADVRSTIEMVAASTNSDITLYAPDGRIFLTTNPMVFESRRLGSRVDFAAYRSIVLEGRRYFIQRERLASSLFYSMYAPLLNHDGDVIAIVCVPYTEDSYDFEKDAVAHIVTILTVFLLLMLIARFVSSRIVDRLFNPLSEMGSKMNAAGLDGLEYIDYDRDDEVSSLVTAYNRMVSELSESSRKLAQAERDKAWSGMARQVAHEIKNPLTPMKLQLQRIIRLKDRNDPNWQDKFDEVAGIILDHIDILTDTANEFSTFAKLYSEEPVELDFDAILQDEISMFEGREDVRFEYFGLSGAVSYGPKPQLTRVFVNLVSNAVQALDGVPDPVVRVSLRNSVADGFYDIVFEDNGPGVSSENVDKLFTPNFTTKNGGSGLGLAISRSILERCDATISYSRSFALGGACFTIKYPKKPKI